LLHNCFAIADCVTIHVWQEKHSAIAVTVDHLGEFRPALRNGWLAYIKKVYSVGTVGHNAAQGESDVNDAELGGGLLRPPQSYLLLCNNRTPILHFYESK
jgi:hypothetical protein